MTGAVTGVVRRDGTENFNGDVSNLLTGIKVFGGLEVSVDGFDILENSDKVLHNAPSGFGGIDVLSPGFDLLDVTLHTLAVLEVIRYLCDNSGNLLYGLDDVGRLMGGEVLDDGLNLSLEGFRTGEASLDLRKVILVDETFNETSNELLNTGKVDGDGGLRRGHHHHHIIRRGVRHLVRGRGLFSSLNLIAGLVFRCNLCQAVLCCFLPNFFE